MRSERSWPQTAVSLVALGLLWAVGSQIAPDPDVLPSPRTVAQVWWRQAESGVLGHHVLATLGRVAAAFALAMSIGTATGVALGRSARLDRWLSPWVTVFLNVPALVVIVLCYLWIGLNEVAAITAVAVNKTAMVTVAIREGMRGLDSQLDDMGRVFGLSRGARFRHVVWPQLGPVVAGAVRNGLAVIWKIVLVVEFLGRSNGVGFQIHLYFSVFDVAHVLAYALSFTALMVAVEYAVMRPWERSATRWRRSATRAA